MNKFFTLIATLLVIVILSGCGGPKKRSSGENEMNKAAVETTGNESKDSEKGVKIPIPEGKSENLGGIRPIDLTLKKESNPEPGPSFTLKGKRLTAEMDRKLNDMQVEADHLLQEGKIDEARSKYDEILKIYDRWLGARIGKARCLYLEDKYEEAEKKMDKILETPPILAVSLIMRGDARLAQGKSRDALEDYRLAIKIEPQNASAYISAAVAFNANGQPRDALKLLKKAEKIIPDDDIRSRQMIYFTIAESYSELKMHREGLKFAEKAAEMGSNQVMVYVRLAEAYIELKETEKAYRTISHVHKLDPELNRDPYFRRKKTKSDYFKVRGTIQRRWGDFEDAAKAYKESVKLDPGDIELYNDLAEVLYLDGKYAEAKKYAQKWLTLRPNVENVSEKEDMAFVKMIMGENREALKLMNEAIKMEDHDEIYLLRGIIYMKLDMKKEARKDLTTVVKNSKTVDKKLAEKMLKQLDGK